jgi:hypothetical protein
VPAGAAVVLLLGGALVDAPVDVGVDVGDVAGAGADVVGLCALHAVLLCSASR